MTSIQKKSALVTVINILIFLVLMLFNSTDIMPIALWGAKPFLPLAFLVAFCMFYEEIPSVLTGLLVGTLLDGFSATPVCFNSIILIIIGLFTAITVHYFFNNNIRSAIALCIICSLFYFTARWIFPYMFSVSQAESLIYLFRYDFPSAIYTTVFIVPFYYLEKLINKKEFVFFGFFIFLIIITVNRNNWDNS